MDTADAPKRITGYCEPLSLRAGGALRLMASSHVPGPARIDVVRIHCGDTSRGGPGFDEEVVDALAATTVELAEQPLRPGSWASAPFAGLSLDDGVSLSLHAMPTRPERRQTLIALRDARGIVLSLALDDGRLCATAGATRLIVRDAPLVRGRWYAISVSLSAGAAPILAVELTPCDPRSAGQRHYEPPVTVRGEAACAQLSAGALRELLLASDGIGECFDGRIARPECRLGDTVLSWNLAADMAARTLPAVDLPDRPLTLHQLPARAVTGPDWDGSEHDWRHAPAHYDAIHFHSDDLYDAAWPTTHELTLPVDLPSGIYAFRVVQGEETDRVPFFVRPGTGRPTSGVALLLSSCTYMAYANHRMLFEGADFVAARTRLRPEHAYVRDHREVGLSCYESHADGSGVMFSSRRRPVLQLRPGADGWNFTPDTVLNAFLEYAGPGHDIIADEDLHADGLDALAPYRVLVTATHPEYWSTAMLDALEAWQRGGGRLMYLGGNGFYWRVAFSDAWPGAIELRRAEDGVRNWQAEPGEYYHAFTGEYGGLWRRLGRPPNLVAGIGFTAQGFEKATYYERSAASGDPRVAWIFDGVDGERIGTSGLGGGAAGQEIDRYDVALGSPEHALVLATATDFAPDMVRVKEEFEGSVFLDPQDPLVRADMVFYETAAGGAVFSVGSIGWFGALARNGYDNDVARITANVLRRFADPQAFERGGQAQA